MQKKQLHFRQGVSGIMLITWAVLSAGCENGKKSGNSAPDAERQQETRSVLSLDEELLDETKTDTPGSTSDLNLKEAAQIRNRKFGDLLRPRNANKADGTPIVLYPAQPWKCLSWKFDRRGNEIYQLTNFFTGKTLQPKAGQSESPIPVVQASLAQSKAQLWRLVPVADGFYKILSVESGLAMTAMEKEDASEVFLFLAPWENTEQQQWRLEDLPERLTM